MKKTTVTRTNRLIIFLTLCILMNNSDVYGQNNSEMYMPKAAQLAPNQAHLFFAGEVKLLDGIFKESQDAEAKNLLSLDMDRLLAPFLIESGLAPKGKPYLGWETNTLPGVALSFYLSGAARLFESTGNLEFQKRINYALAELESCQKQNNGYLLGTKNGKKIFAKVEKEGCFPDFGHWTDGEATPYYSLEKLFSGLRDVYRICHNTKAIQISNQLGNWLSQHMSFISDVELQKIMRVEYGGMNWILSDLYADTGDRRYLEMSKRWQDDITVIPMVQGRDVLNGVHANMQFPKYSGLASRYPYTAEKGDLFGARFFWENVVYHHTYVNGGNSESEFFGPKDSLSHRLTPFTAENCNSYNMLRLTSLLFQIEPKVEYADYFERTLYNHILAAQNREDCKISYFLPMIPGAGRVYHSLEEFSCCICSAFDSYTRHAEYIYGHAESTLFVNLFVASELDFKGKGVKLKQETSFPDKDVSKLSITCKVPVKMDLCIRNPYWAGNGVKIKLNGKQQEIKVADDGYFHINRTWSDTEIVELKLPMSIRSESMADDKSMIALFCGPILLAANHNQGQANALLTEGVAPALVPGKLPIDKWLKPAKVPLTYTTTRLRPDQVVVKPFFRSSTGPYSVYWKRLTEMEWLQREAIKQQKLEEAKKIDLVTLDKVSVCDTLSESHHHLTGSGWKGYGNGAISGRGGILDDQCWKRATTNSVFGYDLLVSDSMPNTLFCRYMGRGVYERWSFKITVDGVAIDTKKLSKLQVEAYPVVTWHTTYQIPVELTKGKKKVTVLFEPLGDKVVLSPRVMEMRILNQNLIKN